jgi:hypothetical protein
LLGFALAVVVGVSLQARYDVAREVVESSRDARALRPPSARSLPSSAPTALRSTARIAHRRFPPAGHARIRRDGATRC